MLVLYVRTYMYIRMYVCIMYVVTYVQVHAPIRTYTFICTYICTRLQWLAVNTATVRLILEMYITAHLRYTHTHSTEAT